MRRRPPVFGARELAVVALADEITRQHPDFGGERLEAGELVARWNDHPGRTLDEVRDLIAAAIRRLERHAQAEAA